MRRQAGIAFGLLSIAIVRLIGAHSGLKRYGFEPDEVG
jgi:hypothetical protein